MKEGVEGPGRGCRGLGQTHHFRQQGRQGHCPSGWEGKASRPRGQRITPQDHSQALTFSTMFLDLLRPHDSFHSFSLKDSGMTMPVLFLSWLLNFSSRFYKSANGKEFCPWRDLSINQPTVSYLNKWQMKLGTFVLILSSWRFWLRLVLDWVKTFENTGIGWKSFPIQRAWILASQRIRPYRLNCIPQNKFLLCCWSVLANETLLENHLSLCE